MKTLLANRLTVSCKKTIRTFSNVLPVIIGMLLSTSLVITVFKETGPSVHVAATLHK
jgi:hypothetical protein